MWNQLVCLKKELVHKKKKKTQGGLISRAAFGRLISPKQIISPSCYLFQAELFRRKHLCVRSATGQTLFLFFIPAGALAFTCLADASLLYCVK